MRLRASGATVAIALLLFGLVLLGEPVPSITLQRIDVTRLPAVHAYLTVADGAGKPVLGLTAREIGVTVDGTAQTITSLESALAGGEHLAIALLFDRSGSMKQSLEITRAAAIDFVRRLSVDDRLAVVSFDEQIRVDAPLTNDRTVLEAAVRGISAGTNTVLYDAMRSALDLLDGAKTRRQAMLVLSDGKDTRSRLNPAAVLADVKAKGVPVYTIGLGSGADAATLAHLAEETGGAFMKAAGPEDLRQLYQSVADLLENQYRLSFPLTFGADQAWHALTVTVKSGAMAQTSVPRAFMATRGPGVTPEAIRTREAAVVQRSRALHAAAGGAFGLAVGLLLILGIRLVRPETPLLSAAAAGTLLIAGALGAVVALLVRELGP